MADPASQPRKSPVDHFLSLFSDVRAGEGTRVVLMLLNVFLLLCAYYVIKTVREPMILADGSAELKSWASAGQALSLLVFVPFYGWLSSRLPRRVLIVAVSSFFVICLQVFYPMAVEADRIAEAVTASTTVAENVTESAESVAIVWAEANDITPPDVVEDAEQERGVAAADFLKVGFIFYVWVGIFSLAMIAQFWSFANDIYTREAGDRLFPIIGIGATMGAAFGSQIAGALFDRGVHAPTMLQVASALVVAHAALLFFMSTRASSQETSSTKTEAAPLDGPGGFALIFKSGYLRTIAAVILLLNVVNTTGEYILGRMVKDTATALYAAGEIESIGAYIGGFYGDFFGVVNILTMLVQAFLVSRIVKHVGMRGVLFALPLIALGAYSLLALGVGLGVYRWAKGAENTTDYSVMNTAKALIWLPTTRAEKYKAKQAIDTFVVRLGDLVSLGVVVLGTQVFVWSVRGFALINLALIVLWLIATTLLYRRNRALADA